MHRGAILTRMTLNKENLKYKCVQLINNTTLTIIYKVFLSFLSLNYIERNEIIKTRTLTWLRIMRTNEILRTYTVREYISASTQLLYCRK